MAVVDEGVEEVAGTKVLAVVVVVVVDAMAVTLTITATKATMVLVVVAVDEEDREEVPELASEEGAVLVVVVVVAVVATTITTTRTIATTITVTTRVAAVTMLGVGVVIIIQPIGLQSRMCNCWKSLVPAILPNKRLWFVSMLENLFGSDCSLWNHVLPFNPILSAIGQMPIALR